MENSDQNENDAQMESSSKEENKNKGELNIQLGNNKEQILPQTQNQFQKVNQEPPNPQTPYTYHEPPQVNTTPNIQTAINTTIPAENSKENYPNSNHNFSVRVESNFISESLQNNKNSENFQNVERDFLAQRMVRSKKILNFTVFSL